MEKELGAPRSWLGDKAHVSHGIPGSPPIEKRENVKRSSEALLGGRSSITMR